MQADHVWNSLMEDDLKSLEAGKKGGREARISKERRKWLWVNSGENSCATRMQVIFAST